jgi:hypothetical protein
VKPFNRDNAGEALEKGSEYSFFRKREALFLMQMRAHSARYAGNHNGYPPSVDFNAGMKSYVYPAYPASNTGERGKK